MFYSLEFQEIKTINLAIGRQQCTEKYFEKRFSFLYSLSKALTSHLTCYGLEEFPFCLKWDMQTFKL